MAHDKKRLENVLTLLLENYDANDILSKLDDLIVMKTERRYFTDEMIWILGRDGYAIFKTRSLFEQEKLKELAIKELYPYVNDQQNHILFGVY